MKSTFQNQILEPLLFCATQYAGNNAFCIDNTFYTYKQFAETVSKIRGAVKELKKNDSNIGLVANDDLETYAAIISLWLEGKCYVPVNPDTPAERNSNVLKQAGITVVIDSSAQPLFSDMAVIKSRELVFKEIDLEPKY